MNIRVDLEICQGHGKCYLTAPEVFAPDEDDDWGRASVLQPELPKSEERLVEAAERAAASCPERAISLSSQYELGGRLR